MTLWARSLALGLLLCAAALSADGQKNRKELPSYDPAAEFTFETSVDKVDNHRCGRNWTGSHLMITYDGKPYEIHLGPAVFIKEQAITFQSGDKVTITASRLAVEEGNSLVAREVRKGEQILVLRNEEGKPAWSAARWQW
jgi:hypothetical protein